LSEQSFTARVPLLTATIAHRRRYSSQKCYLHRLWQHGRAYKHTASHN